MQKYRIDGRIYNAKTPEAAYALHDNYKAGGEVDGTEGMSAFDMLMAGAGSGMVNVGRQLGNMVGLDSVFGLDTTDEAIARQKETDKALLDTGWGTGGRILGEMAVTAPIGVGAGALAGRALPGALRGIGALATEGAVEGAILGGPGERGTGAALGAGFGGGLGLAGAAGGKMIRGMRVDPKSQRLLDMGVDLTPGQMKRRGGMAAIEQSAPGRYSPGTLAARESAEDQVLEVMARRAVPPGMDPERLAGREMKDLARELRVGFKKAYESIPDSYVSRMAPGGKGTIDDAVTRMVSSAPGLQGTQEAMKEASWIANQFRKLNRGPSVGVHDLMKMRSRVRARMANYYKDAKTMDQAEALKDVVQILTDKINSGLDDASRAILRQTDAKYPAYKVIEDVAWKMKDGAPTPNRIATAVQQSAGSKGLYAEGGGVMRDISEAATHAFGTHIQPTGMANYLPAVTGLGGMAMTGGYGGALAGMALPSTIASLGAGTRTGRQMFRGQGPGQKALRNALEWYRKHGGDSTSALMRAGVLSYGNQE
jgi:hypothetical protein